MRSLQRRRGKEAGQGCTFAHIRSSNFCSTWKHNAGVQRNKSNREKDCSNIRASALFDDDVSQPPKHVVDSLPLPDPMVMYTKAGDRHSSETEFFCYKPAKMIIRIGGGDVQRDSTHAGVLLGRSGIDTPMVGSHS